jgi:hypothetical protein|tara:strand:+ start:389 stop:598 length:210 start_codon:yes stop_codon:yes gene_type:complete
MEHENRGEVNNAKDNQSTEEERGVIDIYKEITKAINDIIKEENPNNKGQDNLEDYYNSESEGRDIKGEV